MKNEAGLRAMKKIVVSMLCGWEVVQNTLKNTKNRFLLIGKIHVTRGKISFGYIQKPTFEFVNQVHQITVKIDQKIEYHNILN